MKNQLLTLIMTLVVCLLILIPLSTAESYESTKHNILITEINNTYQIKEHIQISSFSLSNHSYYAFQLPIISSNEDLTIIIDDTQIIPENSQHNIYEIDLNSSLIDTEATLDITYYLPKSTVYFEKTFLQNTSDLEISFENDKIFENSLQMINSDIQLRLIQPIKPDSFNLYSIILIVLLLIIIIVTAYYGIIKRKNGKDRKRYLESKELLETEKILLLTMLKEIEKMHRNKNLSDDSYHKLKSFYKQQTVEIMSVLENLDK